MNRPIEFRAWDKEKNIMIYYGDQELDKKGYNIKVGDSISELIHRVGIHYDTLMEFTGLLDKNGKKIFEGDILDVITCGFIPDHFVTSVIWHMYGFALSNGKSIMYGGQRDNVCSDAKIIGNIFENPELIK